MSTCPSGRRRVLVAVERVDDAAGALLEHHRPPADRAAIGRTHASTVIPLDRSSDAASATVTQSFTPSKLNADPNRPAAAPRRTRHRPRVPRPDESATSSPNPLQAVRRHEPAAAGRRNDRRRLRRRIADVAGRVLRGDAVVVGAGGEARVRVARAGRLADPVRRRRREAGRRRAVHVVADDADVCRSQPSSRAPPSRRRRRGQPGRRRRRRRVGGRRRPSDRRLRVLLDLGSR